MADNLLEKASILLTPTAYNDGSMLSVKPENGDGDFTFSRGSAATRVNAQGLVENVQTISSELVSNGNFSQEGSELITNGDFATDSDWTLTQATISNGSASFATTDGSFAGIRQNVFSVGKTYLISLDVSNLVGTIEVNTNGGLSIGLDITTNGTKSFYMKAESVDIEIKRKFGAEQVISATIDNVSVKEVGQDWELQNGWSIGNNVAVFSGTASAYRTIYQENALTVSSKYRLTFDIVSISSGSIENISQSSPTSYSTVGTKTEDFIATSTDLFLKPTTDADLTIDNVSVKEITDDTDLPRINYEGFSYQDSLGSEEVVNGDFATDSDWTKQSGWSIFNGVATHTGGASYLSQSILNANTQYKVNISVTSVSGGGFVQIYMGNSPASVSISNVGEYEYIFTSQSSVSLGFALRSLGDVSIDNVSVKEYLGQEVVPDSGCGSWLLEPQSTNLIQYSEDFTEWTNTRSSDLSGFISPMGENNATKFISDTTASNSHIIKSTNITISSGQKYTYSVFVKANQLNYVRLVFTDSTVSKFLSVYFNLASETVGTTSDGSTATLDSSNIENFGNGWFRCSVSGDLDTTTTAHARIYLADEDNSSSFNGDGSSGVYIWGVQLEQESYATSYIPTEGAIRTRLADEANNSGNSTLINSTEGVLYAEIAALANDLTNRFISISNGSKTERVEIGYSNVSNKIFAYSSVGNVNQCNIGFVLPNMLDYNKIALKYKLNDFSLWVNGVKVGVDLNASVSAENILNELAFDEGDGTDVFYSKTKAVAVYKEALTDEQLQELTTI